MLSNVFDIISLKPFLFVFYLRYESIMFNGKFI